VLFAAIFDRSIGAVDVDFRYCCFKNNNLPCVP
jgi:hypothetical protein